MDLKRLSNSDLHMSFMGAVQTERNSLKDVLLHVIEVDRRQMYFEYNCSSLFAYMTEVMGYTNGPAQRRIDAARLSYEVPQVVEVIESGALKLDQIRLMQQSIRQVVKENHKPVSAEQKIEVLNNIIGKSMAESEVIVARALEVKIKKATRIQHQADESVVMEISFTKQQWAKLEEMRTLLSHSLPSGSWDDTFEYVADKVIQQKSKMVEKRKYVKQEEKKTELESSTKIRLQTQVQSQSQSQFQSLLAMDRVAIPIAIQREVFRRDQVCQHKNSEGEKCATKWKLQTDHIIPLWAGGDNSVGNLQLLCAGHNRAKYRKEAGIVRTRN